MATGTRVSTIPTASKLAMKTTLASGTSVNTIPKAMKLTTKGAMVTSEAHPEAKPVMEKL